MYAKVPFLTIAAARIVSGAPMCDWGETVNRKALFGWIAAVLVLGGLGAVPATVAHASGSTVVISPPSLVFSLASYRSTSLPQTVNVRNTGASTVTFQRARIAGANPSEFVKESDGCSNTTVIVGGSCQVQVSFAPKAYPLRSANRNPDVL